MLALVALGALGAAALGAKSAKSRTSPEKAKAASAPCPGTHLQPTSADRRTVDAATLCLVNRERAAHHLEPLRPNHDLQTVAARQLHSMLVSDYFGDESPDGQTPRRLIGTTDYAAHAARLCIAEDIGWGTGALASPAQMVRAWMLSPAHRAIILTAKYLEAGVDVAAAVPSVLAVSPPGATYAIEFGARGR